MKICWDNIDRLKYNRVRKQLYIQYREKGGIAYLEEMGNCKNCGCLYLSQVGHEGDFCCHSCKASYENPMYGKHHTEETKKKISKINKGRVHTEDARKNMSHAKSGVNNGFYGKHHSDKTKEVLSIKNKGKTSPYKGKKMNGYLENNLARYTTCKKHFDGIEEIKRVCVEDKTNVLSVRCAYCGKWYIPKLSDVNNRINSINGKSNSNTDSRLYCSKHCKRACPIYNQKKWPKGFKLNTSREVQPELRQMVLERDEYRCRKCGATDKQLHCHHILPVALEPLLSADMDNCMTLCIDCHKQVHQKDGCKYSDIRRSECN
jgi:hypothetical protein